MKVVVVGGSGIGRAIASELIREGHEVIVVEKNASIAQELANTLDCTILNLDLTNIDSFSEIDFSNVDYLIASTEDDRDNIVIALNARAYGVKNILVIVFDSRYEKTLLSIGVFNIISIDKLVSLQASSIVKGLDIANLSTIVKGDARFVSVIVNDKFDGKKLRELKLPKDTNIVAVYRGDEYIIPRPELQLKKGDEIVFITRSSSVEEVKRVFNP